MSAGLPHVQCHDRMTGWNNDSYMMIIEKDSLDGAKVTKSQIT